MPDPNNQNENERHQDKWGQRQQGGSGQQFPGKQQQQQQPGQPERRPEDPKQPALGEENEEEERNERDRPRLDQDC